MPATAISTAAAGAVFGAALSASGIFSPSVIISQMRLEDFHMLQLFLTASAFSALIMIVARKLRLSECSPRGASSLGWLQRYEGNVAGGLLQGVGMVLADACPGTTLVQVTMGVPIARLVLLGSLLGGILWSGYSQTLRRSSSVPEPDTTPAIHQLLNLKESRVVLAYELVCLAVILLATQFKSSYAPVLLHPVAGGLLVGISQATSIFLTGNSLGVSSAYEQAGKIFWKFLESPIGLSSKDLAFPGTSGLVFATGTVAGSWILSQIAVLPIRASQYHISPARAILGGGIFIFGARLAGGCTSGHGLSGMSTLSTSSIITVASMFLGGIATASLLY